MPSRTSPDSSGGAGTAPPTHGPADLGRLPIIERLRRTVSAFRSVERVVGESLHLHPTDLAAVEIIGRQREVTPTQLASALGVTSAAVTFVIDRLVDAGHVERIPNPADRRSTLIRRVPSSNADVAGFMRPIALRVTEAFESRTPAEQAAIASFLDEVGVAFAEGAVPAAASPRPAADSR